MNGERPAGAEFEEHEGEKYLRLLGLEDLADQQIPGNTLQVRDFLDICGEHARPLLVGLESLSHEDPRYEPTRQALRNYISQFVTPAEG
jgi:hypothetical protein